MFSTFESLLLVLLKGECRSAASDCRCFCISEGRLLLMGTRCQYPLICSGSDLQQPFVYRFLHDTQDCGRGRSPERTLCTVLFKICFNALFSLGVPVDLVFYLICPKHTSLMGAAGCVRGSASLPPSGQQGETDRIRQRHLYTCCTYTHTHPRAPTLAYIFINTGGILGGKKTKQKNHNSLRNEPIMGPQGVPLFVLTQRTSYAN